MQEDVSAAQVPAELASFLYPGEDPVEGLARLNDEWGGTAGDRPMVRKLLKLVALWTAKYQDRLLAEEQQQQQQQRERESGGAGPQEECSDTRARW